MRTLTLTVGAVDGEALGCFPDGHAVKWQEQVGRICQRRPLEARDTDIALPGPSKKTSSSIEH